MSDWGNIYYLSFYLLGHLGADCYECIEESDSEPAIAKPSPKVAIKPIKKWEGEDEEDEGPVVSDTLITLHQCRLTSFATRLE